MTPFAKKVYKAVLSIPLGQVRTYKWVARKAGKPKAVRAVGQILKRNPFPFFIPCHRVVSSSGDIGGYVFGQKRKKELLNLEQLIHKSML
jgi:O-6-methylguanine DNA methyltransferase